ncbi:SHOCT domain-containing protein [Virgibacillus sp. NKC19-3]|uniref:SHOCT domain-containing protein n=1 Tax=Virgibacillus saliphilus TaxID=2831674 RepID=UPI001C9AB356|nr:SHOCT domain-containing protein [Virgibacillus sp. NKC19-3]MBY7142202.1 SHOCT domain-containing protein [Virgibacillus sp. NKC19-3]
MATEYVIRIILSIIILIVIMIILHRFRVNKGQTPPSDSLEIMEKRLEKGEITQKEYDKAKRRRGK